MSYPFPQWCSSGVGAASGAQRFVAGLSHAPLQLFMDLVFFGIQGSGKGTQAKRLAEEFDFDIFEAGGELRKIAALAHRSPEGEGGVGSELGKKSNRTSIRGIWFRMRSSCRS